MTRATYFGAKLNAQRHKIFHSFHSLQSDIVSEIINFSHASRMQGVMSSKECFWFMVSLWLIQSHPYIERQNHLNDSSQMFFFLNITIFTDYATSYLCSFFICSIFSAVPLPPTNVKVSLCKNWTAKLSWVPDSSDHNPITHYLIEQESSGNPVVFISLLTINNPKTKNAFLKLNKGSVPRLRMKAVNSAGASRPSLTVETSCKKNETKIGLKIGTYMYYTKRQVA